LGGGWSGGAGEGGGDGTFHCCYDTEMMFYLGSSDAVF
jgi:hypothetical protein